MQTGTQGGGTGVQIGIHGGSCTGQQAGGGLQQGTGDEGCGPVPGQGQQAGVHGEHAGVHGEHAGGGHGLQTGRQGFGKGS